MDYMSVVLVSKLVEFSGRPNEFAYKFLIPALRAGNANLPNSRVSRIASGLYSEQGSPFTNLVFTNSERKGVSLSVDITNSRSKKREGIYFGDGRYKITVPPLDIAYGLEKFGGVEHVHPVSGTISTNIRLPKFAVRFPKAEFDEAKGVVKIPLKDNVWNSLSGFSTFSGFLHDLTNIVDFLNHEICVEELIAKTSLYAGPNSFFGYHESRIPFFERLWAGEQGIELLNSVEKEFSIRGDSVDIHARILLEAINRLNEPARIEMQALLDRTKAKVEQKKIAHQAQPEPEFTSQLPLLSQEKQ